MKILHYYAQGLSHKSGVTEAIRSWASALAATHEVKIATAAGDMDSAYYPVPVEVLRHFGRSRRSFMPSPLAAALLVSKFDLVVMHEGWTFSHYIMALVCRLKRTPYVIVPHGVYAPEIVADLKLKGPRMSLERRLLISASAVHLFFESEEAEIDAVLGRKGRRSSPYVVVAPTGSAPWTRDARSAPMRGAHYLWYGRYEPYHKGLDILLKGIAEIPPGDRPNLKLFGYDYRGGKSAVETIVKTYGLEDVVSIGSVLSAEEIEQELEGCVAYVHPSRWECHSVALMEAIALRTPVIVSSTIHIASSLNAYTFASIVNNDPASWARALVAAQPEPVEREYQKFFNGMSWPVVVDLWETGIIDALRR